MQPLGFSDLTEDEALVVSMFRGWRAWNADHRAEGKELWSADHCGEDWTPLRQLIRAFDQKTEEEISPIGAGDFLSPIEELLLNYVSREISTDLLKVTSSRRSQSNFRVRPASDIARSGKDALLLRVQSSYLHAARGL